MTIERRMTLNPITVSPNMTVPEVQALIKKEKVHRLPVLNEEKKLIGIVTEKDLIYASPSPVSSLSIYEMAYLLSKITVKQIMTTDVISIVKDTTVEEAARIMFDQDISCLPVVDSEDYLIGILTKSDLFKVLIELFGARHYGTRVTFLVKDHKGTISDISTSLGKADIDIIAFGTFMGTDASNAICTVKMAGVSKTKAVEILKPHVMEILDVREI